MLISTDRGAAQIVSAVEDTRFYDDVGCMAADWPAHATRARAFVRVENAWVDAGTAAYTRSNSARTAMGSGVLTFASAADARASGAAEPVMTFDEIVRATGARP
jgi:hypothetical protein